MNSMSKQKNNRADKPEVVTVTVHDLNNLGCGVARMPEGTPDEGLVVFIKGTVTGDVARAQIIKRTKSFLVGKLLEIVTPSPMRAEEVFCTAPEACGGCVYRHLHCQGVRFAEYAHRYFCPCICLQYGPCVLDEFDIGAVDADDLPQVEFTILSTDITIDTATVSIMMTTGELVSMNSITIWTVQSSNRGSIGISYLR